MLAPICLFTYNRLKETQLTVEALQCNNLASMSELYIFSDGPKESIDAFKVNQVRNYIKSINGFKSVHIIESKTNNGLANSIINGVTQIINQYEKVIVLEDDLITSRNFLDFMNQAIDFYANNVKIFSVSGYSMNLPSLKTMDKDYYYGYRASSWGWGTWKNRWEIIDWEVGDYSSFRWNIIKQLKFMRAGSDMPYMLWKQMNRKIDSWAIRWCYDQFKKELFTVFPTKSKLVNIGIGPNATHTKKTDRFYTHLDQDNKTSFTFNSNVYSELNLEKEFRNFFSIKNRLKEKFLI